MAAAAVAVALGVLVAGCGGGPAERPVPVPSTGAARAGTGASPSPGPGAVPLGPYVALGDSYTSGLRIQPQVGLPAGCARSGVNYPSLVARGLKVTEFTDVSCSGARTTDLTAAQRTDDGTNPPQLDALTPATRLVTVGIGGNDAGFLDVLGRCAVESLRSGLLGERAVADAPCRAYYTEGAGRGEVERRLDAAGQRLASALGEIRRRAPQARVLVVGYPALLPGDPARCAAALGDGVAAGDVLFVGEQERALNAMLSARAAAGGAVYVDTWAASQGHDMCAGEAERWIEPPQPAAGAAPVHPNARGQEGMAGAVLARLR
ncbi:SGNH/GDSL hydrolase family protein [Kitasatospora terrestris]|uniref:SGNH/GDSL hydrolase family protein n=1 Tax=Kitasatospora terrestris TaxID=258051 RepID=UPI0031E801A7